MKDEKSMFLDSINERLHAIESRLQELEKNSDETGDEELADKASQLRKAKTGLEKRMREVLDAPEAQFPTVRDRLEADLDDLDNALYVTYPRTPPD
jgi:exonuclease VII large subunit